MITTAFVVVLTLSVSVVAECIKNVREMSVNFTVLENGCHDYEDWLNSTLQHLACPLCLLLN